jgi:hypothetical protein
LKSVTSLSEASAFSDAAFDSIPPPSYDLLQITNFLNPASTYVNHGSQETPVGQATQTSASTHKPLTAEDVIAHPLLSFVAVQLQAKRAYKRGEAPPPNALASIGASNNESKKLTHKPRFATTGDKESDPSSKRLASRFLALTPEVRLLLAHRFDIGSSS